MVRYKARYLLFNILYPPNTMSPSTSTHIDFLAPTPSVSPSELAALIRDSLLREFGDHGAGIAGNLSVKYFSPVTSTGIVRVSREHVRLVWAALTYLPEVRGKRVVVRVVHCAGTIKKAERRAVGRAGKEVGVVLEEMEEMEGLEDGWDQDIEEE
ncbi:RNase P and RNase MRP subunit [Tricharina praecox]|uniref:RNase P and RNase MRP subunit n=1 Tax=Tricharina praecox TaxID=43433 RepID=UPI00221E622B|nr:RNase P and RNase MRP subunit [Tricharina praecox]KAI5848278.1 RNase P and RNase MRP subunit [Tricharina praecox]